MIAMWHRNTHRLGALLLVALLTGAAGAASPYGVELDSVTVHLFLESSGELSRDVTSVPDFMAANFEPMGQGIPNGERFHSFLIKVTFRATGEVWEPGVVAEVRVINKRTGKRILSRTIRGVYVGRSQHLSHVPIFVEGHECEQLVIEVRSPEKTIKKELPFACFE
jgi:hypothetical protein